MTVELTNEEAQVIYGALENIMDPQDEPDEYSIISSIIDKIA